MNRIRCAVAAAIVMSMASIPAGAEISGPCSAAVGTYLTKNSLDNSGRTSASRSLLVLTNGGHVLRFDSDETGAAMDSRPFGDSAGSWRCDGADNDGAVRLTASMLDFTFPDAEGDDGQIARIDVTGAYTPSTESMELSGRLGFLPLGSDGETADALSKAPTTIAITFQGSRIQLPAASE